MKPLFALLWLVALAGSLHAETLDEAARKALLEKLGNIEKTAQERIDERFRRAIRDYSSAMRSEDGAIELYVKCVEKVDFEEKLKDNGEFREWKRRSENNLEDPAFRLALRYQLRWLILVLKSASVGANQEELAQEAFEQLGTVFRDIEKLENQQNILKQSVTASVFARAYGIHHTESTFPSSPVAVSEVFENVILPPLRNRKMVEALKTAWVKRIQFEELNNTGWAAQNTRVFSGDKRDRDREREARDRNRDEKRINEEKFTTETRPDLLWKMEVDLFQAGDEAHASTRMLTHINNYITHKDCRKWVEQLQTLLGGKEPAGAQP